MGSLIKLRLWLRNIARNTRNKLRMFVRKPFKSFEMMWINDGDFNERVGLFSSVKKINELKDYSSFRRDRYICRTVSGENLGNRGNKYFDYICKNNIDIIKDNKDKLLECDKLGNPYIYEFKNDF